MEELVKALALMKNVLKELDWAGEMLEDYSESYVPNLEQRLGQAIFLVEEFIKTNESDNDRATTAGWTP